MALLLWERNGMVGDNKPHGKRYLRAGREGFFFFACAHMERRKTPRGRRAVSATHTLYAVVVSACGSLITDVKQQAVWTRTPKLDR
jgi:hypothetical protein